MTDWRYWITYSHTFQTESGDEDVARLAAAELHAEALRNDSIIYLPNVEVEAIDNAGN